MIMNDTLDKMRYHVQELERIRREKIASGKQPLTRVISAEDMSVRLEKLKKNFLKERKREVKLHPERKLVGMGERHRQPVRCVETGEIYHSMTQLAKAIGLSVPTVHVQISKNRKLKGLTYIKIDKSEEY